MALIESLMQADTGSIILALTVAAYLSVLLGGGWLMDSLYKRFKLTNRA